MARSPNFAWTDLGDFPLHLEIPRAVLLPVVRELMPWGDDHYSPAGPRQVFRHITVTAGPGFESRPPEEPALIAFGSERRRLETARSA